MRDVEDLPDILSERRRNRGELSGGELSEDDRSSKGNDGAYLNSDPNEDFQWIVQQKSGASGEADWQSTAAGGSDSRGTESG